MESAERLQAKDCGFTESDTWQEALEEAERRRKRRWAYRLAKRCTDVLLSLLGLLLLLLPFALVGMLIKMDSPGPVFFKQERVGQKMKAFRIIKFRSMRQDAPEKGRQITVGADSRITKIGALLRRSKLDELPQLMNVLWGHMSLVGSRPEVPRYVQLYPDVFRCLLLERPGITDRASLEFRTENDLLGQSATPESTYEQVILPTKLRLSLLYQRDASWWKDWGLMLKTIF